MVSLFQRFKTDSDTECTRCPYASTREVGEDVSRFGDTFKGRENYRDGKLWTTAYAPKQDDSHCQTCVKRWLDEKKDSGKVCTRCRDWITKKNPAVITIETRDAETRKLESKRSLCCKCFEIGLAARQRKSTT